MRWLDLEDLLESIPFLECLPDYHRTYQKKIKRGEYNYSDDLLKQMGWGDSTYAELHTLVDKAYYRHCSKRNGGKDIADSYGRDSAIKFLAKYNPSEEETLDDNG